MYINAIIIPFRGLKQDKSRLKKDYPKEKVERILKDLTARTLRIAERADYNTEIYLLSKNSQIKFEGNYKLLVDEGTDLNNSLEIAVNKITADNFVIVMADLPLIQAKHIKMIIQHLIENREIVIVPSQDKGTSILAFPSNCSFSFVFGEKSSEKFIQIFRKNGLPFKVIDKADWAFDLDTQKDLKIIIKNERVPIFLKNMINDDRDEKQD